MSQLLANYFKCADDLVELTPQPHLSRDARYFSFGPDILCYGRLFEGECGRSFGIPSCDALSHVVLGSSRVGLPFDPEEVISNLRYERYATQSLSAPKRLAEKLIRKTYYFIRPALFRGVRRHLQRWYLSGWEQLRFPRWPVDTTVDTLMRELLRLSIISKGIKEIPFIWFWPDGANACAILTHDVETNAGVRLSSLIMDMDQSLGIPASFQLVPEKRYVVDEKLLRSIRTRGFEVNVQDLSHDGRLFQDRREFKIRVARINEYRKRYSARGFRSAGLYREQEWYNLLEFEYDMSVPNVAHLDPQRGGCCTVMPYFIGKLVELPVTTTQDYSLFHILQDYSVELWRQQVALILEKNGLIHFIVHPDYIDGPKERNVYRDLLEMIVELRGDKHVWLAQPGDVSAWWKQRSQMTLVEFQGRWQVEGIGSERAVVAIATVENDRLRFRVKSRTAERDRGPASLDDRKGEDLGRLLRLSRPGFGQAEVQHA